MYAEFGLDDPDCPGVVWVGVDDMPSFTTGVLSMFESFLEDYGNMVLPDL